MCQICADLEHKVRRAIETGDTTRARVMTSILIGHRKHQHGQAIEVVTVTPDSVIWPGGNIWMVGREDG